MKDRLRHSFSSALAKHRDFRCRLFLAVVALLLSGLSAPAPFALDVVNVFYPGPAPFYIPVAVASQQGFFRKQSLDVKLIATRAEVDRAALVSGDIDFTLRIGSTILSAARTLPVRTVFLSTVKPFWALVNFTQDGFLDDVALKVLVEEQLTGLNVKDVSMQQLFDFSLLQQVLRETR